MKQPKLTKEQVLVDLCKGKSIGAICRDAGTSPSTVQYWREHDEEFASEVSRILATPAHQARIAAYQTSTDDEASDWRSRFLVMYRKELDRNAAAEFAEKTATEIQEALNPQSEFYDAKFSRMMAEEDIRLSWKIEDQYYQRAINDKDRHAQRFLLPALWPEKYKGVKIEGGNTFNFTFTEKGDAEAVGRLTEIMSRISSEREGIDSTAGTAGGLSPVGSGDQLPTRN